MTLTDYSYEVMELVYRQLTDDIAIDIRLVKDMIVKAREEDISRALIKYRTKIPYSQFNGIAQIIFSVFHINAFNDYIVPGCSLISNWLSADDAYEYMNFFGSPIILSVYPEYNDSWFNPRSYLERIKMSTSDKAIHVGSGRFNRNEKVSFVENGKVIIATKDEDFITNNDGKTFYIKAVLKDPRTAPGYNDEVDEFPIGRNWDYFKQNIVNQLLNKLREQEDRINDSSDEMITK